MGGALVPLIIGGLGELIGLRLGMFFLYITLGYIFSIGIWAKPLINNVTIKIRIKDFFRKKPKTNLKEDYHEHKIFSSR